MESHEERIESGIRVGREERAPENLMRRELKAPRERMLIFKLLRSESHEERIESSRRGLQGRRPARRRNLMRRELKVHVDAHAGGPVPVPESHEERIESLMSSSLSGCDGIG